MLEGMTDVIFIVVEAPFAKLKIFGEKLNAACLLAESLIADASYVRLMLDKSTFPVFVIVNEERLVALFSSVGVLREIEGVELTVKLIDNAALVAVPLLITPDA